MTPDSALYALGLTWNDIAVLADDRIRAIKDTVCDLLAKFGDRFQWEEPTRPGGDDSDSSQWMAIGRTRSRDGVRVQEAA